MAAEQNVIKKADMAKAREVDFAYRFAENIKGLMKALGITRPIPKQAGTVLKAYIAEGTLQNGAVAEGDIIPLSHFKTKPVDFGEITLDKYRKAATAEAIISGGFKQAVSKTDNKAIKEAQKTVKTKFYNFLSNGTGSASGTTFQAAVAQVRGQLEILFEDQEVEPVYFVNPLDIADYLGTASISTQTAFGMTYFEDFLGLGMVIETSTVPKGTLYGTVKDNIVLYYVPVDGEDGLGEAFNFTTDELGLIGVHQVADYTRLTYETTITCGLILFAERIDGIVKGTIGSGSTPAVKLDNKTLGVRVGNTEVLRATTVPAGATVTWTSSDSTKASVSGGVVTGVAAGTATITAKITVDGTDYTDTCAVTVAGA